jgi:hypothetical protein
MLEHACNAPGELAPAERAAAARRDSSDAELKAVLQKVEKAPAQITDAEVEALRQRYNDDELFEAFVAASLASGLARFDAGLRALGDSP